MTQPPNIREVDCCANCKNGGIDSVGCQIWCFEYDEYFKLYDKCDDFKKEV